MKNKYLIVVLLLFFQAVLWYSGTIFHVITEPRGYIGELERLSFIALFLLIALFVSYVFRLWLIFKTLDLFYKEELNIDTIIKFVRLSIIAWLFSSLVYGLEIATVLM